MTTEQVYGRNAVRELLRGPRGVRELWATERALTAEPWLKEQNGVRVQVRPERELTEAITPAVESTLPGVEVLAVELLSPARFCVYVDHPDGVDFALCERVTRLLDAYRTDWTVDVSSPGPERPVRRPEHFRRAIGGTVKLKTTGARRVRGTLVAADDHAVTVSVDGTAHEIPVDEIVRGNLIDEGRYA